MSDFNGEEGKLEMVVFLKESKKKRRVAKMQLKNLDEKLDGGTLAQ